MSSKTNRTAARATNPIVEAALLRIEAELAADEASGNPLGTRELVEQKRALDRFADARPVRLS